MKHAHVWIALVAVPLLYALTRGAPAPWPLALALVLHAALAAAVVLWARKDPAGTTSIGLPRPARGLLTFVAVIAAYGAVLNLAFGDRPLADWQVHQVHFGRWGVIFTAVAAGFCEELIYRGYMMTSLQRAGMPLWVAITLSNFSFIYFHGLIPLPFVVAFFVVSTIFAVLYHRTRSLWVPVYVHGLWDTTVLLVPMAAAN